METSKVSSLPSEIQRLINRFGPCRIITVEHSISDNLFRGMKERWLKRFQGGAQVILKAKKRGFVLVKQEVPWEGCIMWTFPRGGVARTESFEYCVRREVKEEIGLDVEITGLCCVFQNIGIAPNRERVEWCLVVFKGEILSGQMKVLSHEILEVGIFKELPQDFWQRKYYGDISDS